MVRDRIRRLVWMIGILGWVSAAAPAMAALIGDAREPYSADRTVTFKGKTYTGRVYAVPGAQRHEQTINGLRFVAILRADRDLIWIMAPDLKIYAELPLQASWLRYASTRQLGTPALTEEKGGIEAAQYRIHRHETDGSSFDGRAWLSMTNILVRLDGVYTAPGGHRAPVSMSLSHIVTAPQNPALFRPDPTLSRLPPQAIQLLLGERGR